MEGIYLHSASDAVAEQSGGILMENQQFGHDVSTMSVSSDAVATGWVAPLQSVEMFSISEFTQLDSNPGDDGLGIFTQS